MKRVWANSRVLEGDGDSTCTNAVVMVSRPLVNSTSNFSTTSLATSLDGTNDRLPSPVSVFPLPRVTSDRVWPRIERIHARNWSAVTRSAISDHSTSQLSEAPFPTRTLGKLFVCMFVCLFVCLFSYREEKENEKDEEKDEDGHRDMAHTLHTHACVFIY